MTVTFFTLLLRSPYKVPTTTLKTTTTRYVLHNALRKCKYSTANPLVNCNVGTVGHIDHGKTTLTAAITKYASKKGNSQYVSYDKIDQAPQEKARGITINIAHVGYRTDKRRYSHTDCPGHADFVKNMISGTSQMDGAIVVVAATDGQMPQTREHLLLAKQIGIKNLIVFINKADLVDNEVIELVQLEMKDLLESFEFDAEKTPFIVGSALLALEDDTSEYGEPAIQKLLDALDEHIPVPGRDVTSPFYFPIDNVLPVGGRGTVAVGTIKVGTILKKSSGIVMGYNEEKKSAVSDIQIFHKSVDKAVAGENCGLLLKGVKTDDIKKGMVFCAEKAYKLANFCEAELYLLTEKEGGRPKPITSKYTNTAYCETWYSQARVDLPAGIDMLMPGEHAAVKVTFLFKMPILKGQRFALRESNQRTIASGIITRIIGATPNLDSKKLAHLTLPIDK